MSLDVPQWLSQAYVRSVQAAGSSMPKQDLTAACTRLVERWSTSDRHYHGVQHVIDTLTRIETLLPSTHDPDLVRLAAWYHGVVFSVEAKDVYTRNGGEDEEASAAWAEKELKELGVDAERAARVATLIRCLRNRESEASSRETAKFTAIDVDGLALRDAHLGCLAVEPQRYRRYLEQIRAEYSSVPDIGFYRARRAIVHNLLHRRPLFITPLARAWEETARDNLEAENERLAKRLKELEAFAPVNPRIAEPPLAEELAIPVAPVMDIPAPPIPPTAEAGQDTTQLSAVTATSAPLPAVDEPKVADSSDSTPAGASTPVVSSPSRPKTGSSDSDSKSAAAQASARARTSRENLLRYTEQENAAEETQQRVDSERRERLTAQMPATSGSASTFSSLESISDRVESPDRAAIKPLSMEGLSAEEKKRLRREQIQEQMRQRITARQRKSEVASAATPSTSELRRQGFDTTEIERISGIDSGELRSQGYSTGSIPRIVVDEPSGNIASPIHARAAAGAIHVAPTATSGDEVDLFAPPRAAAPPESENQADSPLSATTPVDSDRAENPPGFGMEREPKDD